MNILTSTKAANTVKLRSGRLVDIIRKSDEFKEVLQLKISS